MKKRNDKGFTLVELIVVLVILAILAAILVPALLGYIDKAREKQITTNAEAAYVAAQALATEAYGKNIETATVQKANSDTDAYITKAKIKKLTDIQIDDDSKWDFAITWTKKGNHEGYIIDTFTYTENGKKAFWSRAATVVKIADGDKNVDESVAAGGWVVSDRINGN